MFTILSAVYRDDPLSLGTFAYLNDPRCEEEREIAMQLRGAGIVPHRLPARWGRR